MHVDLETCANCGITIGRLEMTCSLGWAGGVIAAMRPQIVLFDPCARSPPRYRSAEPWPRVSRVLPESSPAGVRHSINPLPWPRALSRSCGHGTCWRSPSIRQLHVPEAHAKFRSMRPDANPQYPPVQQAAGVPIDETTTSGPVVAPPSNLTFVSDPATLTAEQALAEFTICQKVSDSRSDGHSRRQSGSSQCRSPPRPN